MKTLLFKLSLTAAVVLIISMTLFWLLKPSNPPSPSQNPPNPSPTEPKTDIKENFEPNAKLQSETDALLPLFDKMPPVPVYLKNEIINREGSNVERGVAYTTCENKNQPVIFVKKVFYEKANRKMLVNILKHELTHAWQCREGMMWGHDARFRKKFKQVGGFGN